MRKLGSGAYGVVWDDGRGRAVKVLVDDDEHEHYARTFKALARLAGTGIGEGVRPALARLAGCNGPSPVFIMPLYGPTLHDSPLVGPERNAFAPWLEVTVHALLSRGVCHRDFSPKNVARCHGGRLVLIDMDAAFVIADAAHDQPEEGLLSLWYGYPRDVLGGPDVHVAYRPAVVELSMWFSAAACFNVVVFGDDILSYAAGGRPRTYVGRAAAVARANEILTRWPRITPPDRLAVGCRAILA